ncbi:hypothetical protein RvY_11650 [Ramazzottius varieornatus]|uniref:Uncharacterized protein n=1 Tax=Ramazzottius varieornatus TaxID=947166 RepID=A0A1D1VIV8_RAMVA|nr:hypothetical protein RvY_11650 [Ramazzottius varieornatus]
MQTIAADLDVPLAEDKTIRPVTCLTFLGIEIDTIRQTLSLPADKANGIYDLVYQWSNKGKCSKQELQSLIGSLMFASKCVPASRLFIQRLLFLLRGKPEQYASFTLDREFQLDLQWWKEFLPKWNSTASFLDNDWTSSSVLHLYTDAFGTLGMGAFFQNSWFQSRWPPWIKSHKICIEYLQMLPILNAILVWGHKFANKRILMHCDKLGAVHAWKKLRSHNHGVLSVMRRMVAAAAHHNMQIKLEHIPGVMNDVADALSRFQASRFRQVAPSAGLLPTL